MSNLSSLDINVNIAWTPFHWKKFFESVKNLRSLTLRNPYSYIHPLIPFSHLQPLSHLTEFNNFFEGPLFSRASFQNSYGENYEILSLFKELKVAKLHLDHNFINCQLIQETYPHIEFHWVIQTTDDLYYYRGEFKNNLFHGKGRLQFSDNQVYEGDFQNNMREGKGKMRYSNNVIKDGEFKKDMKEGKGSVTIPILGFGTHNDKEEENKYTGEWKNNKREGFGIMIYSNGEKYEGQWMNDEKLL